MLARALGLGCLVLFTGLASPALAQTPSDGERLFKEALALMERAKSEKKPELYAEACTKLEQSYAAEKVLNAKLNLARCEEARGRFKIALGHWRGAAKQAQEEGDPDTSQNAIGAAASLSERMPNVVVRLGAAASAAQLSVDGERVEMGVRVPVDPGEHTIEGNLDGKIEKKSVKVDIGDPPRFVDLFMAGGETPSSNPNPNPNPNPDPPKPAPSGGTDLSIPGWITLGIGGAGLAVFAGTGIKLATSCNEPTSDGPSNGCDADTYPLVYPNLVGAIVGIAGVGVGSILLIVEATDDDGPASAPVKAQLFVTPNYDGVAAGMQLSF